MGTSLCEPGLLEVHGGAAHGPEVAELEVPSVEEDVLYFQVSVGERRVHVVHDLDALADLPEDAKALRLVKLHGLLALHQVEERALGHVLEQAVEHVGVVLADLLHSETLYNVGSVLYSRLVNPFLPRTGTPPSPPASSLRSGEQKPTGHTLFFKTNFFPVERSVQRMMKP